MTCKKSKRERNSITLKHFFEPKNFEKTPNRKEKKRKQFRSFRFNCSTASHSSHSNTTLQTRKRSRTSSAVGDSLAVNKKPENPDDESARRSKNRNRKKTRTLRKPGKLTKVLRPGFGSLQNAVVLAPFHTLKRCFQTKLLDLYSLEKMKKMNHKTRMAKKQNMSFEYDVIELNSPEAAVKKESKATKKSKPKPKSRSASYCQCNKTKSKNDSKKSGNPVQKKRITGRENSTSKGALIESATKRRKLTSGPTPMILKAEHSPKLDSYIPNDRFAFSDAIPSASAASSRSKCDSWETYSNSVSYKEEHLEGSLAISTTSFDSYLEHFDKNSLGCSDSSWKCPRQTMTSVTPERLAADFFPKPNVDSLRRSVWRAERKNSDGQIMGFLDREPQTQKILKSNRHLRPLRRQSKTKPKKPESEPLTNYYLRSHSSSKEKISSERKFSRGCGCVKPRTLEVATQVEGNSLEGSSTTRLKSIPKEPTPPLINAQEEPSCKGDSPHPEQKVESPRGSESSCEIPLTVIDPIETPEIPVEVDSPSLQANALDEHSDRASLDLVTGLQDRLQRPTDSQQPQDKDSDFIFGHRNTPSRLGESCQFSFGLKWDED